MWVPALPPADFEPLKRQLSCLPAFLKWGGAGAWVFCSLSLPYVTLCPCAPGSAGASLAQNPVSQTALGQAQGAPPLPPLPHLPQRARATGCPITSGVYNVGKKMRNWASSPLFHLYSMPTLTFLISSKITQVFLGRGKGDSLTGEGVPSDLTFLLSRLV